MSQVSCPKLPVPYASGESEDVSSYNSQLYWRTSTSTESEWGGVRGVVPLIRPATYCFYISLVFISKVWIHEEQIKAMTTLTAKPWPKASSSRAPDLRLGLDLPSPKHPLPMLLCGSLKRRCQQWDPVSLWCHGWWQPRVPNLSPTFPHPFRKNLCFSFIPQSNIFLLTPKRELNS